MRVELLLGALVLALVVFGYREGVNDTLSSSPSCPTGTAFKTRTEWQGAPGSRPICMKTSGGVDPVCLTGTLDGVKTGCGNGTMAQCPSGTGQIAQGGLCFQIGEPMCPSGSFLSPYGTKCVSCTAGWRYVATQIAAGTNPLPGMTDSPSMGADLLPNFQECPAPSWFTIRSWAWDGQGPPTTAAKAAAAAFIGASPPPTTTPDPTATGNMADLETEYQNRKKLYDSLVASAIANDDQSKIDAIAAAQVAMSDSLNKMMAVSAQSGTESQQQELTRRIMQIQRDYNGLLVGTDKLQTLRLLQQSIDVRDSFGLKLLGGAFLIAIIALVVQVMRTR